MGDRHRSRPARPVRLRFRYTSTNLPALSTNPSALLKERATFTYCKHIRIDVRSPQPRSARRPCLCESAREPDVAAPAGMNALSPYTFGRAVRAGQQLPPTDHGLSASAVSCSRVRGRAYLRTVFCAARDGRAKPTRDQTRVPSAAGTNQRFRPPSQLCAAFACCCVVCCVRSLGWNGTG